MTKQKFKTTTYAAIASIFMFVGCVFNVSAQADKEYISIEWTQLMPADDLQALLNPPEFIGNIQDGTAQDSVDALSEMGEDNETAARFQAALKSSRVVDAFNNINIRLPGFVVPIESDEEQRITSFFIVPYFGACLHMPPPPPNQIIYVETKEGIELDVLYDPLLFEGTIVIEQTENAVASSAYTLRLNSAEPYEG